MSRGGREGPDDWADGGGHTRPRYLSQQAPSPPAPNGHRQGASTQTEAGLSMLPAKGPPARKAGARGLLLLAWLAVATVALVGAVALLAWVVWRLATAGG